ncbi:hypothetical protein ACFL6I_16635, partial [candidate division KSB1 bacterium]
MVQNLIKRILLIVIILCSLGFYHFTFIGGYHSIKYIKIAGIGLIFFFLIIHFFYDNSDLFPKKFKLPIGILLIAVILSMFVAYTTHGQSFAITAFAQRSIYFFFLYFLLHAIKLKPNQIEQILLGFGIAYAVIYLIQYFLYPTEILDVRMVYERNTVRIFMPGLYFFVLAYYFALNKFYITNK